MKNLITLLMIIMPVSGIFAQHNFSRGFDPLSMDTEKSSEPAAHVILPGKSISTKSIALSEGFDDITTLPADGWALINNSNPLGTSSWFQGNSGVFTAHEGADDSYIGANFNNTSGVGTISNWLITPVITLNNGDEITFWTRSSNQDIWPDRLQVRLSLEGSSTDIGATATSVGDFTTLLLSINENLQTNTYPVVWTEYALTLSGLGPNVEGRIAFRYFVTDGGTGPNSNYIGIDSFSYEPTDTPPVAVPISSWAIYIGFFLMVVFFIRRLI
jgi:hypothetical protein